MAHPYPVCVAVANPHAPTPAPSAVCPVRRSRKGCSYLHLVAVWPREGAQPARRLEILTDGDAFGAPSALVRPLVEGGAIVDTYRNNGMREEWCSRQHKVSSDVTLRF